MPRAKRLKSALRFLRLMSATLLPERIVCDNFHPRLLETTTKRCFVPRVTPKTFRPSSSASFRIVLCNLSISAHPFYFPVMVTCDDFVINNPKRRINKPRLRGAWNRATGRRPITGLRQRTAFSPAHGYVRHRRPW